MADAKQQNSEVADQVNQNPPTAFQQGETRSQQPDTYVEQPTNEELKTAETSFQEPDSTVEQPIDEEQNSGETCFQLADLSSYEEQKVNETSPSQPDSTIEETIIAEWQKTEEQHDSTVIDPTDDPFSLNYQQVGDIDDEEEEEEEASLRAGSAPPRPRVVTSIPQTNDRSI